MKSYFIIIIICLVGCNSLDTTKESKRLFNSKNYRDCINFSNSLDISQINTNILMHRAWSYAHMGKNDSASYEFEKIFSSDSTSKNAILGLLQFHPSLSERIKYGNKYLKTDNDSFEMASTYQKIGHTFKELNHFNSAIQHYDSSIAYLGKEISTDQSYIYYKKGLAQFYNKQFIESRNSLEIYLAYRDDNAANKLLVEIKDSIQQRLKKHTLPTQTVNAF